MSTLLMFFAEAEDLLKQYFDRCFTPATFAANKAMLALVRGKKLGLRVKVRLVDTRERLCWERFEQVRSALERMPLCVVTEIDGFYSAVAKSMLFPKKKRYDKFNAYTSFLRALLEKNSAHLETLGHTMSTSCDSDLTCRNLTWTVEFPRMVRVKIHNLEAVTARMLAMLGQMPALEQVAIRGGLHMTMMDRVFPDDAHASIYGEKPWTYSALNPPVMKNVFPIFGRTIRTLDLSTTSRGLGQLVDDFVAGVLRGQFDKLERLSFGYMFRRMTRLEGEAFLRVLPLCRALTRIEVGCCSAILHIWQVKALDALAAKSPGLVIDRVRGSRM
jgi:hypothetical protein